MFDGPKHTAYIALCRELRLERKFEEGDAYIRSRSQIPNIWHGCFYDGYPMPENSDNATWLPRLDQWLAMLEEAGWREVTISTEGGSCWVGEKSCTDSGTDWWPERYWPTREEAAARLWCAVTGR